MIQFLSGVIVGVIAVCGVSVLVAVILLGFRSDPHA